MSSDIFAPVCKFVGAFALFLKTKSAYTSIQSAYPYAIGIATLERNSFFHCRQNDFAGKEREC